MRRRRQTGRLGRFGGNVCGHCLPLCARTLTSSSLETDAVGQPGLGWRGKGKGEGFKTPANLADLLPEDSGSRREF